MASHQPQPIEIIQSWWQKVVECHMSLLDELINFSEGKCSHHQLANHHADQLASPPLLTRLRPAAPTNCRLPALSLHHRHRRRTQLHRPPPLNRFHRRRPKLMIKR
eukprot:scaffold7025_cov225-Skeletonema_marinoi.AAC.6